MTALKSIKAVKHGGLVGDRWYRSRWIYPLRVFNAWLKSKPIGVTSVSILSMDDLQAANATLEILAPDRSAVFTPSEMRRNIVVQGPIDLNALLGQVFWFGGVKFRGTVLCTPCALPPKRCGKLADQPRLFVKAFMSPVNRGGLRAQVLSTGYLKIGDSFRLDRVLAPIQMVVPAENLI